VASRKKARSNVAGKKRPEERGGELLRSRFLAIEIMQGTESDKLREIGDPGRVHFFLFDRQHCSFAYPVNNFWMWLLFFGVES